jgi:hypothetical protein
VTSIPGQFRRAFSFCNLFRDDGSFYELPASNANDSLPLPCLTVTVFVLSEIDDCRRFKPSGTGIKKQVDFVRKYCRDLVRLAEEILVRQASAGADDRLSEFTQQTLADDIVWYPYSNGISLLEQDGDSSLSTFISYRMMPQARETCRKRV